MIDPTTSWFSAVAFFAGYGGGVLTSDIRRELAKWFARKLGSPAGHRRRSCDPDWCRSFSHENTAPDSSTQRPRLWRDVRPSFSHENTNPPSGPPPLKLLRRGSNPPSLGCKPAPPAGPPPRPAPGMRREYLYSPATMAECGGPCWEAQDPRACDCGALWRDLAARWPTIYVEDYPPGYWGNDIPPNLPRRSDVLMAPEMDPRFGAPWDEGTAQRGNGHGGPTTPKPEIVPKPQYPGGYISLDGAQPFRVRGRLQPPPDELDTYTHFSPQGDTPNPPPTTP